MNKLLACVLLTAIPVIVNAQTKPLVIPPTQDYGKVSKEDLELKDCDFEKDANAEVLFDKGGIFYDQSYNIQLQVHKRIKIFNDNGKYAADIHIKYYGANHYEFITDIQAETINLVNGVPEITK